MKPDFLVAGIMKSGTTYLDDLIRKHPDIYMPKRSMNYSYFDNDVVFKNGFDWYKSIFSPSDGELVIGQTSADCAFNPGTMKRIKEKIPNVKLIFIVRCPIDRAYSLYWHQIRMGREVFSFEKSIDKEKKEVKKSYYNLKMYSYIGRSRYKKQFSKIREYFDEEQLMIIPFELFIKHELFFLNYLFEFIGVKKIRKIGDLNVGSQKTNPAKMPSSRFILVLSYALQKIGLTRIGRFILNKNLVETRPPKMKPETRQFLEEELKDDIAFHQALCDKYASDFTEE